MTFRYYYSNHKFSIALCNLQRLFVSLFLRKQLTLNRGWMDGRTDGQADCLLSGQIFDKWKEGRKEINEICSPRLHPDIEGMDWERSYYSFDLILSVIQI